MTVGATIRASIVLLGMQDAMIKLTNTTKCLVLLNVALSLAIFLMLHLYLAFDSTDADPEEHSTSTATKMFTSESCQNRMTELENEVELYRKQVDFMKSKVSFLMTTMKLPLDTADLPTIFMITPTHGRLTQKADLTRLCQTLMNVQNLKWIVIEDGEKTTPLVTRLLAQCSVDIVHLFTKTSTEFVNDNKAAVKKPRGIEQRNLALRWLRDNLRVGQMKGVIYFGDDDNTYHLKVFEEMRYTKKASVWPVGIAGGLKFEGPVCRDGRVVSWHAYWATDRKFQIDFAGFAVNLDLFLNSSAHISLHSSPGYLENNFLNQLVSLDALEAKADNCKQVYVWHTRTEKPSMMYEDQLKKLGHPSNPDIEV